MKKDNPNPMAAQNKGKGNPNAPGLQNKGKGNPNAPGLQGKGGSPGSLGSQKVTHFQQCDDGRVIVLLSNGDLYERPPFSEEWNKLTWMDDIRNALVAE